jgi:lipid-A-disaccharide synthase
VSGDLQGALLVQALYRQAAAQNIPLSVSALGGDRMAAAGATLVGNTTAIGSVGILEALPYVLPTLRIQQHARRHLQAEPPDLIIYIDYMGPNLALGKFIQQRFPQVPTVYYIAPQQWAWAFSRKDTEALVAMSDAMVAIFPQEADYYRKFGAQVHYFGHPLVDRFFSPARSRRCPRSLWAGAHRSRRHPGPCLSPARGGVCVALDVGRRPPHSDGRAPGQIPDAGFPC